MTESWHLYVTSSHVRARRVGGLLSSWIEDVGEWRWDSGDPTSLCFAAQVNGTRRQALHVYLGAALVKWGLVTLPSMAPLERQRAAQAYLEAHYGIAADEWTCVLERDSRHGPQPICAIRRALLHRLHELARERQLQLVSVVPHVQSVWNCFLRNTALPATLLTLEDDGLTVMVAGLRQLELVTTFVHQRQAGLIERELQRLRLGAANQALGNIHLGGPVSLHAMAAGVPLALALRPRYLTRERYRDFRELGFCEVEST